MKAVIIGATLALSASAAGAQEASLPKISPSMSREQTFEAIGARLDAINETLQGASATASNVDKGSSKASENYATTPQKGSSEATANYTAGTTAQSAASMSEAVAGAVKGAIESAPSTASTTIFSSNTGEKVEVEVNTGGAASGGVISYLIGQATGMIEDLSQELADNPYVEVDGFSVSMGVPPSVDIAFKLKEPPKP